MPTLFVIGNKNVKTFANAIAAAHLKCQERYGKGLTEIFVFQSPESKEALEGKSEIPPPDWSGFLEKEHGLHPGLFGFYTVDLSRPDGFAVAERHVQKAIGSLDLEPEVYIDLTNGSSIHKFLMSTVAYLIGTPHIFVLDSIPREEPFASSETLHKIYFELPNYSALDAVGYAWLTEVRRFGLEAETASKLAGAGADAESFTAEMRTAVLNWFRGRRTNNGALLGGAVSGQGRAFENLIHAVCANQLNIPKKEHLWQTLRCVIERLQKKAPAFEPELLDRICDLLRILRNASAHEYTSPDFGRIRARLATELLLATSEYFHNLQESENLGPAPQQTGNLRDITSIAMTGRPGEKYYFGLDGDNTGRALEALFLNGARKDVFKEFSQNIEKALEEVKNAAKKAPLLGEIIFCAGDDLLFNGCFDLKGLENLKRGYHEISKGQTCCIGYGRTPKEAYIALKIAKATPGKNAIFGMEAVAGPG